MAETQVYSINIQGDGDVVITDEVVSVIAGLAALETEGVNSLVGGVFHTSCPAFHESN